MPFIRTSKGRKIPFSSVKISEYISLSYKEVYNKNLFKYRGEINEITRNVISSLEKKLGNEENSEWDHLDILKEIHDFLLMNTHQMDVFYTFDDFYKNELEPKKTVDKTKTLAGFKKRAEFDPAWNIYIRRIETDEEFEERKKQGLGRGDDISMLEKRERRGLINQKRSDWMKYWETISLDSNIPLDINILLNQISEERNTYSFYTEQWEDFWTNILFDLMQKDLRNYGLCTAISLRKMRYELIGGSIFSFSELNIDDKYDLNDRVDFDFFSNDNISNTYSSLFIQFITQLTFSDNMKKDLLNGFDLKILSKKIDPNRDRLIDWRAIQKLKQSGSLNIIPSKTQWRANDKLYQTKKDCYELIQWMYMRLSISLSLNEKDENKNQKAIELYDAFSTQKIIPTAGMLREAGKSIPNYLEDQSSIVADKYENIWESINETAIGTKWTGTVSLDWREVRSKGSPIKNGIRESGGILPFLQTINTALNAQDREPDDKPVTNIIPIFHKDVEIFLDSKIYSLDRFKSVISLSDIFMDRAKNAENWTMFDPKVYPEILEGTKSSYLLAESKIKEREKLFPKSYKVKRADFVLKKIISELNNGTINITFNDNQQAFNNFNKDFQCVNGFDGVGSFIIHKNKEEGKNIYSHWAKWPSVVVNISKLINASGIIEVKELQKMISLSLYSIDSMINQEHNILNINENKDIIKKKDLLDFRNSRIGILGFNEVMQKLIELKHINTENEYLFWSRTLFSTFQKLLLVEENLLSVTYGAADIIKNNKDLYFDPNESINLLKKSRNGSLGLYFNEEEKNDWLKIKNKFKNEGHRFITKTLYSPFEFSASLANISDGGFGAIQLIEKILDDKGKAVYIPTSYLIEKIMNKDEKIIKDYSRILKNPEDQNKWNNELKEYVTLNPEKIRSLLRVAGEIRPFLDHGVCFTIPNGLFKNELVNLLEQSWFYGVSTIRTKKENKKIDENLEEENEF